MTDTNKGEKLAGTPKFLVELGPLIVFFVGYSLGGRIGPVLDGFFGTQMFSSGGDGVFVATALFIPAWIVATAYSVWKERQISPILILTGILIVGFGGATLIFQSKFFYYFKSTLIYLLFAGLLGGGLLVGRNFLKMLLGGALDLPDDVWRRLTLRFVWLYLALAAGNEILWRTMTPGCLPDVPCQGEAWYVRIETFGFAAILMVFFIANIWPYAQQMVEDEDTKSDAGDTSRHLQNQSETAVELPPKGDKSPTGRPQD